MRPRPPSRTAEAAALLVCVRRSLGEDLGEGERAALCSDEVNWADLLALADRHLLLPRVHRGLQGISTGISDELRGTVKAQFLRNGFENRQLLSDLDQILKAAGSRGLPVLVVKGPYLARYVYADEGVRVIKDLDLIVREEDFRSLMDVLEGLGYRSTRPLPPEMSGAEAARYTLSFSQIRMAKGAHAPVEVHLRLLNFGCGLEEGAIFERALEVRNGEVLGRVPGVTDHLLLLLTHVHQHHFTIVSQWVDIHAFLARHADAVDFELLREIIERNGLRCSVLKTLAYGSQLLGTPVPAELGLPALGGVRSRLFAWIWRERDVLSLCAWRRSHEVEAPLFFLLGTEGLGRKLEYLWRILFPPGRWLAAGGTRGGPAAYLRHWLRILPRARTSHPAA